MLAYKNLSLKDLPGEEWKDIPDFVDYYAISNYGRIKSLARWVDRSPKGDQYLKEKIRKQSILKRQNPFTKRYCKDLLVNLYKYSNGKGTSINRLVYFLFVKEFDMNNASLIVTFKNNDHLDCHFKNLRLITVSELQRKTYVQEKDDDPPK